MTATAEPISRPRTRSAGTRLAVGVAVLIVGLLCLAGSRLAADSGHHAYDPNANSPAAYDLSIGTTYQLSAPGGVQSLTTKGLLGSGIDPSCGYTGTDGVRHPMSISSTLSDTRDLDVFATFEVTQNGRFTISCTGIDDVFVDDADSAAFDTAGFLTLAASVLLALGFALAMSGAYRLGTGNWLRRLTTVDDEPDHVPTAD